MNYKTILTYLILTIFAIAMYYLSWINWIIEFILSLCIYTIIFFCLHYIWVKVRKKPLMYFPHFINYFLQRISIFLLFIIILFTCLTYLLNEVYPAAMPEFTITNWVKVVKFQAMSHIWTKDFYNQIVENIKEHKNQWWVYFYEWVKPGTKENIETFNQAIWIEFDENLYKNFSKLYWVQNQDNNDFLWLVNNLDFNIDLSMDEIVELYKDKINTKTNTWNIIKHKIPVDANKIILETLSWLNERQQKILVYINQAILNFIISSEWTQNFLTNNFTNKDLFDIILWKRNETLASTIIESKYDNIYITYWLLHFKWVLELLKEHDPKWRIIYTKNLYPIKN